MSVVEYNYRASEHFGTAVVMDGSQSLLAPVVQSVESHCLQLGVEVFHDSGMKTLNGEEGLYRSGWRVDFPSKQVVSVL